MNEGGAPANDIDIYMHLPDGFTLYDPAEANDGLTEPEQPVKPIPPRNQVQIIMDRFDQQIAWARPDLSGIFHTPRTSDQADRSAPQIRRSNSYDVTWHVDRLKQNQIKMLRPLLLAFDSDDHVGPFGVSYRINAANVPEDREGELHVVVNKPVPG